MKLLDFKYDVQRTKYKDNAKKIYNGKRVV